MKIPFIDFLRQYRVFKKEIEKEVLGVLRSGRYILGEKVENFENNFSRFCGAKYALGVNNGTTALILALLGLNIKPGDEVITQPNTFIATVEAILAVGAKPVLVDINPKTYSIDERKIEEAVSKKTKAILPVHLFGQPANMAVILEIAKKHNLFVIEDTAQAHGAKLRTAADKWQMAGSIGDVGCFSFYPTKVLGACGEAGAVVTSRQDLFEKMKRLRDHGSDKKYYHREFGLNFRMEAIQGAVLAVKMKHLKRWIGARRKAAKVYNNLLKHSPVIIPFEPKGSESSYYVYVVRAQDRENLQDYLGKEGIATMIHYPVPLHLQPSCRDLGYKEGDFPEAEKAAREIVSLPFFPELKLEEQKHVAKKIRDFYAVRKS